MPLDPEVVKAVQARATKAMEATHQMAKEISDRYKKVLIGIKDNKLRESAYRDFEF